MMNVWRLQTLSPQVFPTRHPSPPRSSQPQEIPPRRQSLKGDRHLPPCAPDRVPQNFTTDGICENGCIRLPLHRQSGNGNPSGSRIGIALKERGRRRVSHSEERIFGMQETADTGNSPQTILIDVRKHCRKLAELIGIPLPRLPSVIGQPDLVLHRGDAMMPVQKIH